MTAIREVDLSAPLMAIEDLRSDRCMLVFRWRGRVIGRTFAHVEGGSIDRERLQSLVTSSLGREALRAWLDDHLAYDQRVVIAPRPLTATVAICTHERPNDLRRALTAVMLLRPAPFETIVVDNAPATDATRRVVDEFAGVRYVHEPERGLNVARNRALRSARGDVVAFTDDDAVPEPAWVGSLMPSFQTPRVLCVTGLTLPIALDNEAQELFEEHCTFSRGFRRRVFDGQIDNPLAVGPVGAGANMAVLREAVLQLGGFDERLDGGRPTRSGGDHEMFTRILRAGNRIVYDPSAVSWHRHRSTIDEVRQTVYGYGVGVYAMWTGLLLEARELGVLKLAWEWFRHSQLRALLPGDTRPPAVRVLVRDEIRGCLYGPRAWLAARRLAARSEIRLRSARTEGTTPRLRGTENSRVPPRPARGRAAQGVTDTPTLTVVVPTHNRREAVLRLLDALSRQNVPPPTFQVVVAVDGSTDGTAQALQQRAYPFRLDVLERPSQGPAAARNEGARHAAGRILLFLDDDVQPDAHLVAAHLELHAESADIIGIGLLTPIVETNSLFGKILRYWWTMMQESILSRGHRFSFKDLLSGHFSIARARFDQLGGFEASLRCHEDYEFGFRALQAGMDFRLAAGTDAFHHDDTTLDKALRRKFDEGVADVALGRRHPALVDGLPFAWQGRTSRKERLARKVAWSAPRAGDVLARIMQRALPVFEAASLRFRWRVAVELLLDYWYWRGVAAILRRPDELRALLATATAASAPMTVDLASGFAAAEAVLDAHRPAAAQLVIGEDLVATIPAYAGYERLRGAHLRPLLARWCDLSYLEVAARHGRIPETLVPLARRFEGVPRGDDE